MSKNRKRQRNNRKKKNDEISRKNAEGYDDPTAYFALKKIQKEESEKRWQRTER